jgi:hypothetical protein
MTFAPNQTELARELGVDRRTIRRWRRIEGNPGCQADGRLDVDAWREWIRRAKRRPAVVQHVRLTRREYGRLRWQVKHWRTKARRLARTLYAIRKKLCRPPATSDPLDTPCPTHATPPQSQNPNEIKVSA